MDWICFKQIVNHNNLNVLPFLSKIKIVDQCDKPCVKMENVVFDEENHEQNHGSYLDIHVIDRI